jgi:hypothetical protein
MTCSELSATSAAFCVVSRTGSELHPVAATNAAAVNPTQAAVYLTFIRPHPVHCESVVPPDSSDPYRHVRIADSGTFFPDDAYGSRTAHRPPGACLSLPNTSPKTVSRNGFRR